MMIPGANRGIDKTAEEEEKADKQYDTGHATVKSMSFSHTGCLTHNGSLGIPEQRATGTLSHTLLLRSIMLAAKTV